MKNKKVKIDFEISFDEDAGIVDINYTQLSSGFSRRYSWEVRQFTTSAGVLDYIVQIAKKPWATDELVGALVQFLNKLLYLQGNYCGFGKDTGFKDSEDIHTIILEERVRCEFNKEQRSKGGWKVEGGLESFDLADLFGDEKVIAERIAAAKLKSKWISRASGDTR